MKYLKKFALCGATLVLASCTPKADPIDPLAGGGGLVGQWASSDGVFTATLSNGNFVALANDTGTKISDGSYYVVSSAEIRLNWVGVASGQNNSAVCQRPNVTTLNCTDAQGRTFTLSKTG